MTPILLVARVALGAVLATAGAAKLADLPGSRRAMVGFGLPAGIAAVAGTALPVLELLVAVAVLLSGSARWAAVAALVLFAAFSVAIIAALRRGEKPDCHCFGRLHSAPAGRAALLRNTVLAAIAGLVVAGGAGDAGGSLTAWIGRLDATQATGLGAAVALAVAVAALVRLHVALLAQNGRLLARVERLEQDAGARVPANAGGLPVGAVAPRFDLPAAAGGRMSLDLLEKRGKPILLVFSDPGCAACRELAPDLAAWYREHAARVTVVVLARGAAHDTALADEPVMLLQAHAVASAYGVSGTPSAILLGTDGRVASRLAAGTTGVRTLLRHALEGSGLAPPPAVIKVPQVNGHAPSPAHSPSVGAPAPALSLPDLDARPVELRDLYGVATLLLFWNPACGFCRRMLEDVRALDADPRPGAPQLVVVSTGDPEDNRAEGLRSPVLIDPPGRPVLRAFGAGATPAAVLVDASGTIASPVAVGAQAVLALAGARAGAMA